MIDNVSKKGNRGYFYISSLFYDSFTVYVNEAFEEFIHGGELVSIEREGNGPDTRWKYTLIHPDFTLPDDTHYILSLGISFDGRTQQALIATLSAWVEGEIQLIKDYRAQGKG